MALPKYVLKNKRLSKTKTVFIFRRNHLDIREFKKTEDGWFFEEQFSFFGNRCSFQMIVHSDDIYTMYEVNSKTAKVKGNKHNFGIFFRMPKKKSNFNIKKVCNKVEFNLKCSGTSIAYDSGKGIKNTREEKILQQQRKLRDNGVRTAVPVPKSVSWSAAHPFQGGGVSPR